MGLIRPGYVADIVLVRRNPVEDVAALSDIEMVMIAGKFAFRAGAPQ